MSFEVVGKLYRKYPLESKSDRFQTREFVIEIQSGQYSEYPKFQLLQERCSLIDGFNEGEDIKVFFDLRGREWQGKFFTNLNAWRIENVSGNTEAIKPTQPAQQTTVKTNTPTPSQADDFPTLADAPFQSTGDGDLPF
jgi:hypothetical protein